MVLPRLFSLLLVLLSAVQIKEVRPQNNPCPFNSMCSCKNSDVTCVSVPFAKFPNLAGGGAGAGDRINHADVIMSGLQVIENDAFNEMHIESLRLMTNQISTIQHRAFVPLASMLRYLDLSYNQLDEIPSEALQALKTLDWLNLHSNQITELESVSWSTDLQTKLTTLFLGSNELHDITNLDGFKSIQWLSLDSNLLQSLGNLPKSLQTLSVANNYLVNVEALARLPNLNWIVLSNNYIREIVIPVKKDIEKLDLSNNLITTVHLNLNNTYYIKDLILSYNQITKLNANAFRNLNVARMFLKYNKIDEIHDLAFNHVLEYLDLEHNRLTNINSCFRNLKKLKYLYLHNNKIEFIHVNTFEHLVNLKSISLSGNKLTRIPNFVQNKRLVHLNLGYNFISELILDNHSIHNETIDQNIIHHTDSAIRSDDQYQNDQPISESSGLTHDGMKSVNNENIHTIAHAPNLGSHHLFTGQWSTEQYSDEYTDSTEINIKTPYENLSKYAKRLNMFYDSSRNRRRHYKGKSLQENAERLYQKYSQEYFQERNKHKKDATMLEFQKQFSIPQSHVRVNPENSRYKFDQESKNDKSESNKEKQQHYDEYEMFDYYDEDNKYPVRNKRNVRFDENQKRVAPFKYSSDENVDKINDGTHVKHRRYKHFNDHNYNKYVRHKKNIITINKTLENEDFSDSPKRNSNSINEIGIKKNSTKLRKSSNRNEDQLAGGGHLLNNLETLLLRCNKITDLNGNLFKYLTKLEDLSLSFNKIQVLELNSNAFDGFENLKILEISFSLFNSNEFPYYVFNSNLNTLVWLAMDNNNIKNIRNYSLYNLTNLNYINLEYNKISKINNNLFHFNIHKKLKEIRLSNNNLELIESDTFYNLKELNTVMMSYNLIKAIKTASFKNLNNLLNVVLSFNQIKYIYPNAFLNLPNLIKLDLQFNKLKDFNLNAFSNITNKQVPMSLNLSNNYITNLNENDKKQAPIYIKTLDLSNNRIQEVPVNFLQTFADSLRKLFLGFNEIKHLDATAFGNLDVLEVLSLDHNNIAVVVKRTFIGMPNLQIIDMSSNEISMLTGEQFYFSIKLRILDISHNRLRSLPRDVFSNTVIERLDISYNSLVVMPSNALGGIGLTLRDIDLSHNQIEHIDSTMFIELPMITNLNLSHNRLTILPDNTFISVNTLIQLDLSSNPLRANFKELFHYLQKLKYLFLSNTNLMSFPYLPLPDLLTLHMSNNNIKEFTENCAELLGKLRRLTLSGNQLQAVPSHMWSSVPYLKELDLSNNPIRLITKDSFSHLRYLQSLNVQNLPRLERFDSDALMKNVFLQTLKIQTWPKIEKYRFRLANILASLQSLKKVSVDVQEVRLNDQLHGVFSSKLRELEITGRDLKFIDPLAFDNIDVCYDLTLKISNTQIEELPSGLFDKIENIEMMTLDLSHNKLSVMNMATLYSNVTKLQHLGTTILPGGLHLKGNPWICDCGLIWLSMWLKRWLREALQIHTKLLESSQQIQMLVREATCYDPKTNAYIPIIDLNNEYVVCSASALSASSPVYSTQFGMYFKVIYFVLYPLIYYYYYFSER
uniref:Chaoptin n=1 Tax=Cacopsylla melanoneura TaxID=428564 RepID=A0A8D8QA40_9HEMI